jgi:dipeptidyl aminopeptidase/acylaminoacyl peptidase
MRRLLAVAAAFASISPAAAAATPRALIVFSATPQGSAAAQLYSIRPDGRGLKRLTAGANSALAPALSPDGGRIAFARLDRGIFTINRDGSGLRRVTTNGRDGYPTWSPDGTRIAFVRPVGTVWRLFVVPASGGKPRQLPQTPSAGRPTWTKHGLLVATSGDLVKVDTSTGHVLKYYDATIDAIWGLHSVGLSPAASWLTYVGTRQPIPGDMECGEGPCQRFGLYLESLTGKRHHPRMIVKDAGPAGFSPDGGQIAYVAGGALMVRSVASDATRKVPTPGLTPTTAAPPSWR